MHSALHAVSVYAYYTILVTEELRPLTAFTGPRLLLHEFLHADHTGLPSLHIHTWIPEMSPGPSYGGCHTKGPSRGLLVGHSKHRILQRYAQVPDNMSIDQHSVL